jgi:uncharacterized protein YaaQ
MKLVFAIVHDDDAHMVIEALSSEKYITTRLCSTGGFLRAGNTTIMIGIEDEELERVLEIIKSNSKTHKQNIRPAARGPFPGGMAAGGTIEITVGGATIFVTEVERMEKY